MANGLFTPQGFMSPDEVLGLTGFDQQGYAAPTVEEIRAQLQRGQQSGAFRQRGQAQAAARPMGASGTKTGMGGKGMAGAIRDMRARSTLADFAKEGGNLNTVEGALKASQLLAEKGFMSQAQAYADNAAAMQAANREAIGEKFGEMNVIGTYGDNVLVGQINEKTGKAENVKVIDKETYENQRAELSAKKKGAGEGSVPSAPNVREVEGVSSFTKGYEFQGMEIDRTFGGLDGDDMGELNRRLGDGAKTFQSKTKEAGEVISFGDALEHVAPSIIKDNVIYEEGDVYDSVRLRTLEEEEEEDNGGADPLGLF